MNYSLDKKGEKENMYRFFFLICVLCFPALCFCQEKSTTFKVAGRIPSVESAKLYQIQVGSFKNIQNAEKAFAALRNASLNPVYDKYLDFTRVKTAGISAKDVADCIQKIQLLGFREIWISEDDTALPVSTAALPAVSSTEIGFRTIDYDKALQGDLSAFAGYWVNGDGERLYLQANGTTYYTGARAGGVSKAGGYYSWGETLEDYGGSGIVMLFPVGFDLGFYSDKTKVRLYVGHDFPLGPNSVYYKESVFPATHITTDNLRLRENQSLSSPTIAVLGKGTKTLIKEWGNIVTVDGKSARWAYVYTINGFEGWCYSDYLEKIK